MGAPKSKAQLQAAIVGCLKLSSDCSKGPYGPIAYWDVSAVTDMNGLFDPTQTAGAALFNGDLSKWDVSRVTNMNSMFNGAKAFNSDISNWDVSNVEAIGYMFGTFMEAKSFNGHVGNWDVSNVKNVRRMFSGASSFSHKLCNKWYKAFNRISNNNKKDMFTGSGGRLCKNG